LFCILNEKFVQTKQFFYINNGVEKMRQIMRD